MAQTTNTKSTWKHTILVVVGIAIAILLSWRTYLFTPTDVPVIPTANTKDTVSTTKDEKEISEKDKTGGGSPNINSTARLFQFFTENLPYLNNK